MKTLRKIGFFKENSTSKQTITDNEIIENVLKPELSDLDTESDYEKKKKSHSAME